METVHGPCHTVMSFANAGKRALEWSALITFPTKPNPTCTTIDCLPEGEVPILFSLEQMCNLQIDLVHRPGDVVYCACPSFRYHNERLRCSTSGYIVIDLL